MVLRPNNILPKAHFFKISTSNLVHNLFRCMALNFLAGLEFDMFIKYIFDIKYCS